MDNAKDKRLEPRFAEAGETARRETDQMPGRREHIQIHRISALAPVETQIYTRICFLTQRPHYARRAPLDDDVKVLERIYDSVHARDLDGELAALPDAVAWANG